MARRARIWLTTGTVVAVFAAAGQFALAQEKAPVNENGPAPADDLAAETAYLKALFAEKELKDYQKAAEAYAAVASMKDASPEIVQRSTLGTARCYRALGRHAEADGLLAPWMKHVATMKSEIAAEFKALQQVAAPAADGSVTAIVLQALDSGNPRDMILPYADRAVPALGAAIAGSSPWQAARASSILCSMDSPLVRETLQRLVATANVQFPRELANAIGTSRDSDEAVALLRRMANAEARRAGYWLLMSRGKLNDASVVAIVSDTEARPPLARLTPLTHAAAAQVVIAALVSGDAALRAEGVESLAAAKAARGIVQPPSLAIWATVPAAAFGDPAVVALLGDVVYEWSPQAYWQGVSVAPATLRALAAHADTAAFVLSYATSQGTPSSARDRDAIRLAFAQVPPGWSLGNVGSMLDGVGLNTPDELGRIAANWKTTNDFASMTLQQMPSIRQIDGPLAEALLAPSLPPAVLGSSVNWIGGNVTRLPVTADVSIPLARLAAHPTVGPNAIAVLSTLATRKLLSPDVDVVALVRAIAEPDERLGQQSSQSLLTGLRALPAESRARLLPLLRADFRNSYAVLPLVADLPGEEVDRRIEELARTTTNDYVAGMAIQTLVERLGARAETSLVRWVREGPDAGRKAALQSVVGAAGKAVPFEVAERVLLLGFEVAPGASDMPPSDVNGGWSQPIARVFPVESRRRLARAALRSKSEKDRRWGAQMENTLRDDAAWDDLLVVAEDPDPVARNTARQALRAIDAGRREMEEFRSLTELRKVRDRIGTLLASPEVAQRAAGVAAVVALRSRDWMGELVRIAAEDKDASVRTAACNALVTLGSATAAPAPATAPETR